MSVRPSAMNTLPSTVRIVVDLGIGGFLEKSTEKIEVPLKFEKNNLYCTVHEVQRTATINSFSFLVRMRNISDKIVAEIKTQILCSIFFFNCAVYEIMWKNMVQPERPQVVM